MTERDIIPGIDKDVTVPSFNRAEQKWETKKWEIKPHKGHSLFEINLETEDIKIAEFTEIKAEIKKLDDKTHEIRKKVIIKPNCIYISALNIQNAAKKFAKKAQDLLNQSNGNKRRSNC